jgi:alkylation response protein AidB-like acyl-CoA dehydrogenase
MNQVAETVAMEELVRRARALIPTLRARARSVEEARRVSAETTGMLREADLFRLMQPARFGGFEYGFTGLIDIVFEIGRGCGSTAWCYGLGAVHQWLLATFPLQAQNDVWGPTRV